MNHTLTHHKLPALRFVIMLIVSILIFGKAEAQEDITGKWQGTITIDGEAHQFYMMVNAKKKTKLPYDVYGKAYLFSDSSNQVTTFFEGEFTGGAIRFTEDKFDLKYCKADRSWCLKGGSLRFSKKGKEQYLSGEVAGNSPKGTKCSPHLIEIEREEPIVPTYNHKKIEEGDASFLEGQWHGIVEQYSFRVYRDHDCWFIVNETDGNKFWGEMHWPESDEGITAMEGYIKKGRIYWTETNLNQGAKNIVLHGWYEADLLSKNSVIGIWGKPIEYIGADYILTREEKKETEDNPDLFTLTAPDPDQPVTYDQDLPVAIMGRRIDNARSVPVTTGGDGKIKLSIRDSGLEDGDTISLNLNGKWILENYALKSEKLNLDIQLDKNIENNYLVLFAHNLGTRPPNTASVSFHDGKTMQRVTLRSDLERSEGINFKWNGE